MPLYIGEINKLVVKRETDISYTLAPEDDDLTTYVFLHFNQATRVLKPGEIIDVFLYYDQKKRLCATMEVPLVTTNKYGFAEVVNIIESAGVFVNIGISKDILLSKDFLPPYFKSWPRVGEKLPCILQEKLNQLVAKIINKQMVKHKVPPLQVNDSFEGTVIRINPEGISVCTSDFQFIYIHRSYLRKSYHVGEVMNGKIINITPEGDYHGSTIAQKELSRLTDSEVILNNLRTLGGIIPLGNASSPDEIAKYFSMSKSAFKRAVGALYKQKLITIEDHKITLI